MIWKFLALAAATLCMFIGLATISPEQQATADNQTLEVPQAIEPATQPAPLPPAIIPATTLLVNDIISPPVQEVGACCPGGSCARRAVAATSTVERQRSVTVTRQTAAASDVGRAPVRRLAGRLLFWRRR